MSENKRMKRDVELDIEEDDRAIEHKKINYQGIKGLGFMEEFITKEEENELLQKIDNSEWDNSISRRTQHYGYIYDYKSKEAAQVTKPIPTWCQFVIDRLIEKNIISYIPDQLIINEYIPGQGIYPHVDNVKFFEDGIVSVSLASGIIMDFIDTKNPANKKEIWLERRSVLALHRDARYFWRHGITARKMDKKMFRGRRVSLTFRKMKFD